jgi:hypothetical protein
LKAIYNFIKRMKEDARNKPQVEEKAKPKKEF